MVSSDPVESTAATKSPGVLSVRQVVVDHSCGTQWERTLLFAITLAGMIVPVLFKFTVDPEYGLFPASVHAVMCGALLVIALIVGVGSLQQLRLGSLSPQALLGISMFGAALIDSMHALGGPAGGSSGEVLPASDIAAWTFCRTVASLVLGIGIFYAVRHRYDFGSKGAWRSKLIAVLASVLLTGVAMRWSEDGLTQILTGEAGVFRYFELIPFAILLCIVFPAAWRCHGRHHSAVSLAILLGLLPMLFAHAAMALAHQSGDPAGFFMAHGWLLSGYGVILTGLWLDQSHAYLQIREDDDRLHREVLRRQEAERGHRDASTLYTSLMESLPLAIFRKDRSGHFVDVNNRLCFILNTTREEILGKTDADFHPAERAEKYRKDDEQVMASGQMLEDVEEHPNLNGRITRVRVLKSPVFDAEGQVIGVQGMFWQVEV